jgi:MATE family multidrug resistance protein
MLAIRNARAIGAHLRPIFALGGPVVGSVVITTAINIATVGMLGRLGNAAIAGAGVAGVVYGAICALIYGLDTGVQAIVARAIGAGRKDRVPDILAAAHVSAVPLAIAAAATAWAIGPKLIALILRDPASAAVGGGWIAAAAPSTLLLAITLPINAVWIGSGRPAIAMAVNAAGAPLQIALTFLFVFGAGPVRGLQAVGGALAMDATLLAGVVVQTALALAFIPGMRHARPRLASVREIARIGWPISAQQSLLQVAVMGVLAVIAQLGTASAAIANVLLTLADAPTLIGTGLGVAAATLVGQTLGRGDARAARAWGWRTANVAVAVTAPMGLLLALAPKTLLGPFLRDPATLAAAILPGRIVGLGVAITVASIVLGFALRGAGATKLAAVVPFASLWIVQLPLMAFVGLRLHQGLVGVIWVQTGVTVCDVLVLGALWAGGLWTRVRINVAVAQAPLNAALTG